MADHDHDHGHGHGQGHAHSHVAARTGRAFAIGVSVNLVFVGVELVAGVVAGSVALMSDAAHNFGDVLGLVLAWGAMRLAQRRPSRRRTYGLRRTTILASLANAILLLVSVGAVSWEAVGRLRAGGSPEGVTMLVVAAVGVVINAGSALLFLRDREKDANVRGAFLVRDVHDLHIWAMSTTETALTAHLIMDGESCHPAFLRDVAAALERVPRFS